jgi:hypothetical protein
MRLPPDKRARGGKSQSGIAEAADIATIDYQGTTDVKKNNPDCSVLSSGEPDMEPSTSMPDEDLFQQDTEQWLRKYMTDWDDKRIEEELRRIRLMSLVAFYESAIKLLSPHPELLNKLPQVFPAIPRTKTR